MLHKLDKAMQYAGTNIFVQFIMITNLLMHPINEPSKLSALFFGTHVNFVYITAHYKWL